MEKILISSDPLRRLLMALNGPGHYIREIQFTRKLPGNDNPINILVEEFNSSVTSTSPDFKEFANAMLDIAWQGNDADGGTIQELAEKHGLLKETEVTESCGEHCVCAEVCDFPTNCFRKTY